MQKSIILLTFTLFVSTSVFTQVEGLWILHYYSNISDEEPRKRNFPDNRLMKIEGDKIITIEFESITTELEHQKVDSVDILRDTTALLSLNKDLFWIKEKSNDTISFSIVDENLIAVDKKWDKKFVYRKVSQFHKPGDRSKFELFLLENLFHYDNGEFEGGLDIAFLPNDEYLFNELDAYGYYIPFWRVEAFENQIFIILVGLDVTIHQLKEFGEKGATFIAQDEGELIEYSLDRIDAVEKYDKTHLLGKWGRKYEQDEQPSLKPDWDSLENNYQEILIFDDSTFTVKFESTTVSSNWEIYINNEVLLFPQLGKDIRTFQWTIKSLTEDELVVERWKRKVESGTDDYEEIVKFHKIH